MTYRTALICLLAAVCAAQEETTELPLSRVVLFTSGVGYFQHDGKVKDDARVDMRFGVEDINDLLKSLVLRDYDGGQVRAVTYASRDPVSKTLKAFAIDLTGKPNLAQILDQVRGEWVEVTAPAAIEGTIVGVETKRIKRDDEVFESDVLNLLTDQGLYGVHLDQVQRIRFLRPELDGELRKALAALAASHDTQKKAVGLRFVGKGARRVSVAYVNESPVWKTSYRLVLSDDEAPFLQGWAIVENTSDADWKDVRLTLVSGRPISFLMDLYRPLYIDRPEVELDLHETVRPQRYEEEMEVADAGAAAAAEKKAKGARRRAGAPAARKSKDFLGKLEETARSVATAGDVGELFQYEIDHPVTLPRQQSALLPIVNAAIEGEKVSIYNKQVHEKHPLNGLRLRNSTAIHLMQGPITVFDGNTYAGDAQIDDLPPGGRRLISYAIDLRTEVEPVSRGGAQRILTVKIVRGTIVTTRLYRNSMTYSVKNRAQKARKVLVEHPFRSDWKLVSPKEPTERTRDVYRFELVVGAGDTKTLEVVEERHVDQSVSIRNLNDRSIGFYLRAREVPEDVRAALRQVVALKSGLAKTASDLKRKETRVREIDQEQRRIRENMARLAQNSPLYARYVEKLTKQEDELETLRKEIVALRDRRGQQQKTLDDYIANLGG